MQRAVVAVGAAVLVVGGAVTAVAAQGGDDSDPGEKPAQNEPTQPPDDATPMPEGGLHGDPVQPPDDATPMPEGGLHGDPIQPPDDATPMPEGGLHGDPVQPPDDATPMPEGGLHGDPVQPPDDATPMPEGGLHGDPVQPPDDATPMPEGGLHEPASAGFVEERDPKSNNMITGTGRLVVTPAGTPADDPSADRGFRGGAPWASIRGIDTDARPPKNSIPMPEGGLQSGDRSMRSVIGKDNRKRVRRTKKGGVRPIGKLYATTRGGDTYSCTGFMISKRTVATAGHCVVARPHPRYPIHFKKWAFFPALNKRKVPYGVCTARARNVAAPSQYTLYGTAKKDFGIVKLDCKMGKRTGWFRMTKLSKLRKFKGNKASVTGYPGDKPNNTMWRDGRRIAAVERKFLGYRIDTGSGQSGGPVGPVGGRVLGIHAKASSRINGGPALVPSNRKAIRNLL